MAARSLHEVRDAVRPQLTPEWPVENYVDARTGQHSRRQYLGSCVGGVLLMVTLPGQPVSISISDAPRATPANRDRARSTSTCGSSSNAVGNQQLVQTGKPICQRSGDITWLTTMPLATYSVDGGPDGGSVLIALCRWSCDREGR